MKTKNNKRDQREDILTYSPILKYMIFFCIIAMCIVSAGGIFISAQRMKKEAEAAHENVETQVKNRIDESLKLLESMAVQPEFFDPSIPPLEKVEKLDRMTGKYGYMLICLWMQISMSIPLVKSRPAWPAEIICSSCFLLGSSR